MVVDDLRAIEPIFEVIAAGPNGHAVPIILFVDSVDGFWVGKYTQLWACIPVAQRAVVPAWGDVEFIAGGGFIGLFPPFELKRVHAEVDARIGLTYTCQSHLTGEGEIRKPLLGIEPLRSFECDLTSVASDDSLLNRPALRRCAPLVEGTLFIDEVNRVGAFDGRFGLLGVVFCDEQAGDDQAVASDQGEGVFSGPMHVWYAITLQKLVKREGESRGESAPSCKVPISLLMRRGIFSVMGVLITFELSIRSIAKVLHVLRSHVPLLVCLLASSLPTFAGNVRFPAFSSEAGYLGALLVNEVAFPGERGYVSEANTKRAMENILLVLDARIRHVPEPYERVHIAQTSSARLLDVMTAGGVHGQIEGFYRDASGAAVVSSRIEKRLSYLFKIANDGAPGCFARLLNHASALSSGYIAHLHEPQNLYLHLRSVHGIPVTGRAYSWMTDRHYFHSGGNFVRIPNDLNGSLSGNRFFTLKDLNR